MKAQKLARNFHLFERSKFTDSILQEISYPKMLKYSIKNNKKLLAFVMLPNHYRKMNRIEEGKNNNNLLICKENHVLRRRFPPS